MERLIGTWSAHDVDKWPFTENNFGKDVDLFADKVDQFFLSFNDVGTGDWSLGIMSGTLKVRSGQQSGHFMGELLVVESTNDTDGWKARLNVTLLPQKTARVSWAWNHGPAKGVATTTFWALDTELSQTGGASHLFPAPTRRSNAKVCAIM